MDLHDSKATGQLEPMRKEKERRWDTLENDNTGLLELTVESVILDRNINHKVVECYEQNSESSLPDKEPEREHIQIENISGVDVSEKMIYPSSDRKNVKKHQANTCHLCVGRSRLSRQ